MNLTLATKPANAGKTSQVTVRGITVTITRVGYDDRAQPHDIAYQKYTADYRQYSARPFRVGSSAFATLEAAARAVVAKRTPTEAQLRAALGPCGK